MQDEILTNVSFSSRLKLAMRRSGLNQRELSIKAGVTTGSISLYVNDKRRPGADELLRLAKVLNTPMEWLLGENVDIDNCELCEWKQRALIAEEELSQLKKAIQILTSTVATHEKPPRG